MRRMAGPDPSMEHPTGRPHRSLATAYLIWFLVGVLGGHRFYLGDARGGKRYLVALAIGVVLPIGGLVVAWVASTIEGVALGLVAGVAGLLVLLAVLGAAIVDAFRMPALTRRANEPDTEEEADAEVG